MYRISTLLLALGCAVNLASASAGDHTRHLSQFEPEVTIAFDGSDPQATAIARKMYGHQFGWIDAKRIWLKAPDDGFEQMAVQLSTERNCGERCLYAVLFYDDRSWLELWRGRANLLQLGAIGADGLRGIHDGSRMWLWSGGEYRPQLSEYRFKYRPIRPDEKASIERILSSALGEGGDNTRYAVLDLPLKDGLGALVSISSLAFCGQAACPVFVLDRSARILARYYSIEGQSGVALVRDANGNPLIETVTAKGVAVYRIGEEPPLLEVDAQGPIIAGRDRP